MLSCRSGQEKMGDGTTMGGRSLYGQCNCVMFDGPIFFFFFSVLPLSFCSPYRLPFLPEPVLLLCRCRFTRFPVTISMMTLMNSWPPFSVTVSGNEALGGDSSVHSTYVQYVDGSPDSALYAATNGQMYFDSTNHLLLSPYVHLPFLFVSSLLCAAQIAISFPSFFYECVLIFCLIFS